jgi:rare lipoprotein A
MIRIAAALFCACVCLSAPAYSQDIFAGTRPIDVQMTNVETCIASHYGVSDGYHGRRTASGG